jgi:hypothetical protein
MFAFDRNVVAIAYKFENQDKDGVSEQALQNYDARLFTRYHRELVKQAQDAEIPLDEFSLSTLLLYALLSSSAKTVKGKVGSACRYYESVRPQPVKSPWMAPVVTDTVNEEEE